MDKLLAAKLRPGIDSREQPLYTLREAAYYLGVKPHSHHLVLRSTLPDRGQPEETVGACIHPGR